MNDEGVDVRVARIDRIGEPEVLRVADAPEPVLGPAEVLIGVEAIGVNFTDLWSRTGLFPAALPLVPGIEAAGRVLAVGANVASPRLGDRVLGLNYTSLGGYAESFVVEARWAWPLLPGLSAETAVAIGIAGMTAYAAVHVVGRAEAGEVVVVHAAAGGVGSIAVQLARAAGLTVVAVASRSKHAWLASHGESAILPSDDWLAGLSEHYPDGVDLILDGTGPSSVAAGLGQLRWGGRIVAFGAAELIRGTGAGSLPAEVGAPDLSSLALAAAGRGVLGLTLACPPEFLRPWFDHLQRSVLTGTLEPRVGGRWPLAGAAAAHRAVHDRTHVGKLILIP